MTTRTQPIFWAHKILTAGILTFGAFLNLSVLAYGMDRVASRFFTPHGEMVLTAIFFTCFTLGVAVEVVAPLESRARRITRRVVSVYMLMLTLMHGINNLFLHNTADYARAFSKPTYSAASVLVLAGMALFVAALPRPRVAGSH